MPFHNPPTLPRSKAIPWLPTRGHDPSSKCATKPFLRQLFPACPSLYGIVCTLLYYMNAEKRGGSHEFLGRKIAALKKDMLY